MNSKTQVGVLQGSHPLKVAILTNVLPSYRQGFYDRLFARTDIAVTVYCQESIPGLNIRTIHARYPEHVRLTRTISAKREAIAWQFTPWREVHSAYDVVFVAGNPRVVSHAMIATALRLGRRNVVLWTMGHSYRGQRFSERARLLWSRMFGHLLVYTDAEVRYLRQRGFATQRITAMNNGLDQASIDTLIAQWTKARLAEWQDAHGLSKRTILLSCARLDPKNRFEQVVAALPTIVRRVPDVIWCVIGSGVEAERLQRLVSEAGLDWHVRFAGEIHEEPALAPWFLSAAVFIHPAAVGLSLLHAFGYGLPTVTHGNAEHQGPEFAAFCEGRSGRTFPEGDAARLAEVVIDLLADPARRAVMSEYVQGVVRCDYNVDQMVDRFLAAAAAAAGVSRWALQPTGARDQ